jgi:hypothetical protein
MFLASPSAAAEFEVLISRACRQGMLDIYDLLDTFLPLVRAAAPGLADARRLDLESLVPALRSLPVGLHSAPRLWLVPDLGTFTHTSIEGSLYRSGRLEDGTLLCEAPFGLLSVNALAATLCVVAHEQRKAWRLLAEKAEARPADAPAPALAQLAFDLGQDEAGLGHAISETGGELLQLLRASTLPAIALHASLSADTVAHTGQAAGRAVVAALAEMGLGDRPLHLWLGDPLFVECLSPYSRELREVLLAWGDANPADLGPDLRDHLGPVASEDALYALVNDFLLVDPRLWPEKVAAERTVGILHREAAGQRFEICDLGRVDPALVDARLPAFDLSPPFPVLVRLGADPYGATPALLEAVFEALGPQVASVTLASEGSLSARAAGALLLPRGMLRFGQAAFLSGLDALTPADLASSGAPVGTGLVHSLPFELGGAPAALFTAAQLPGIDAVEVGSAPLVEVLLQSRTLGRLRADVALAWAVVHAEHVPEGRPTLASLAGHAAVAIGKLRQIVRPPRASTPPPPQPARPAPSKGDRDRPMSRGVRLKV